MTLRPRLAGMLLVGALLIATIRFLPVAAQAPVAGGACMEDPPTPVVAIRVRAPACSEAGQELEYRICVENRSSAAAHHVLVRNPLPANARFVRAHPEPSAREPELLWQLGTLEGGACREIVLVLQPLDSGEVQNCARVQFEHGQCVRTRIAGPAPKKIGAAGLSLEVVDSDDPIEVGSETRYEILVRNQGTAPASDVRIEAVAPEQLEIVRVRGPVEHRKEGRRVSFQPTTLAPGAEARYIIHVQAMQPGQVRFQVDLHAAQLEAGPVHEEESTNIFK